MNENEFADPTEAIDESPPPGFEPQVDLPDMHFAGLVEREPDLIAEAEGLEDEIEPREGFADDGDDEAEEGDD
jgi:hypothetical protein